jgi:hypothetical protein
MKRDLLWIDSRAGLAVGFGMFVLSGWLGPWMRLPRVLLLSMGAANLAYGLYSGWLFTRTLRPPGAITALVVANGIWAMSCLAAAYHFAPGASVFGLAHLVGEGLIVGTLAVVEWRRRESLVSGKREADAP